MKFIFALLVAAAAAKQWACNTTQDIPYIHQPNGYTCGSTSLHMAMKHHGKDVDVYDICNYIGTCTDGVGEDQLISAAKHYGFSEAQVYRTFRNISYAFNNGQSVIGHIYVQAGSYPKIYGGGAAYSSYSGGHYIEMHGMTCDPDGNRLYYSCNDPASAGYKDIKYSASSMQDAWGAKDYHFISLFKLF